MRSSSHPTSVHVWCHRHLIYWTSSDPYWDCWWLADWRWRRWQRHPQWPNNAKRWKVLVCRPKTISIICRLRQQRLVGWGAVHCLTKTEWLLRLVARQNLLEAERRSVEQSGRAVSSLHLRFHSSLGHVHSIPGLYAHHLSVPLRNCHHKNEMSIPVWLEIHRDLLAGCV